MLIFYDLDLYMVLFFYVKHLDELLLKALYKVKFFFIVVVVIVIIVIIVVVAYLESFGAR